MEINFDSRAFCNGTIKPLSVCVFGSRTLADERVEIIIVEYLKKNNATKIITSQEPRGVCEVAQKVAKKYGYPLQLHFLNMQYLRGTFEQRSKEAIKEADRFLLIHDGVSKGTHNEKILIEKSGKPLEYHVLDVSPYDKSVGFNIEHEWGNDMDNQLNWDEI